MKISDIPSLENDVLSSPKAKCKNCGCDVLVYHHPLCSGSLIYHDNGGVSCCACVCGCKHPEVVEEKNANSGKRDEDI